MGEELAASPGEAEPEDEGYPTAMESDPGWPVQTQEPILPLFEGVALPATWSRLGDAMDQAFCELWRAHALPDRHSPPRWVSLHYGRIYVNAHGLERLRAAVTDSELDTELAAEPVSSLDRARDWLEQRRIRRHSRSYADRVRFAEGRAAPILARAAGLDLSSIDTSELARGPLDRAVWMELLLPWLATRVAQLRRPARAAVPASETALVRGGIRFEMRCSAELGRRFARMKICHDPGDIVYLTLEERSAALRDPLRVVALVDERRLRVETFATLEVPERFSGSLLWPQASRRARG